MATYYAAMKKLLHVSKVFVRENVEFLNTSLSMKPEIILNGKEFSQIILFAYSGSVCLQSFQMGKYLFIQGCSRL